MSSVIDHAYYYCYLGLVHAMLRFYLSLIYPPSWIVRVDTCLLDMPPNHLCNPHISPDNVLNLMLLLLLSLQSCPTLRDPIDSSPPGSPVPGILQARILEWVAIAFSLELNRD